MTVKIPLNDHLKGYKYYQAVYLGEELERFDAVVEGDFLVFETDHLSQYAILGSNTPFETSEKPTDPTPEPPIATDTTTLSTGDLDGDGAITIQDAYQTLMAYANASAGLEDGLTETQRKAVDVDGDGAVTIQDAYKILCYYADASAGLEPSWT